MTTARFVRGLLLALVALAAARPASASSISVLVGDKDGFGLGLLPGQTLPCPAGSCLTPVQDWRSLAEAQATNGAQLTDLYSALYDPTQLETDCLDSSSVQIPCSPNGATGWVYFPFVGQLSSTASITMLLGDFESTQNGAMLAQINGLPISFAFDQGYLQTGIVTIYLTPAMIAAANLAGAVQLFLDHSATFDANTGRYSGSFDYIAVDYFELNSPQVPEPGTWLLIGTGLAALVSRRLRGVRPGSNTGQTRV